MGVNHQNNSAESAIRRKFLEATKNDIKRQKSKNKAKRCDKKRHKATFSLKVLTVALFWLRFLLTTATNKGVAIVRREGGSSLKTV